MELESPTLDKPACLSFSCSLDLPLISDQTNIEISETAIGCPVYGGSGEPLFACFVRLLHSLHRLIHLNWGALQVIEFLVCKYVCPSLLVQRPCN